MPISLVPLNLADVIAETLLYGIFLVLNVTSITIQLVPAELPLISSITTKTRIVSAVKKPMFIGAIVLLLTVTAHWICSVIRLFEAMDSGRDPLVYYSDLSQPTYVAKTGILVGALFTGDIMIIYRLWIVRNRNSYIIIFPSLTLIGLLISGIAVTYQLSTYSAGETLFGSHIDGWVIAEGVFTIATNGYCTGLIAWYIWRRNRVNRSAGVIALESPGLTRILAVFIESALLYSSWLLFFIITFVAESPIETLVADCLPAITGIAFSIINVRARIIRLQDYFSAIQSVTLPFFREQTHTDNTDSPDQHGRHDLGPPNHPLPTP